jgi:isoleucyl-tRNA synthetase
MDVALEIVGLTRVMRMKANLKVRQPLHKIMIPVLSSKMNEEIELMADVIKEEINVKEIEYVTEESGILKKKAKPNFRILGPKYGKNVQQVAAAIRNFTSADINRLEKQDSLEIKIDGIEYKIILEDMEILHEDIQGWMVESSGALTVALDTNLDESLIEEGLAREFVNRIQNMRKESGFEVVDRIIIYYRATDKLTQSLEKLRQYIQQETLAERVINVGNIECPISLTKDKINNENIEVGITKT